MAKPALPRLSILLLSAFLCLGTSLAPGPSAHAQSSDHVTIVTEDFPPYNYREGGELKGLSAEVVEAVLEEVDIPATFAVYPWARSYWLASNRENHLIFSIARIPEREKLFQWVGAIAPYRTSFYKLKTRDDIKIASLEDAKAYHITVATEDVIHTYLKGQGFNALSIAAVDDQTVRLLAKGRVDLIAYDEASFGYALEQQGLDPALFERVYRLEDLSDELYMAFSNNTAPELVEKFRVGLEAIKNNGVYETIQARYALPEKLGTLSN